MYILLSGYHPFDVYGDLPEHELLEKIISVSYDFDDPVWSNVSEEAKILIKGLLQYEPNKRMSLTQYLDSHWITGKDAKEDHNSVVVERIAKFNVGKQHFRTLIVAKLASNKFKASLSRSRRSPSISAQPHIDKSQQHSSQDHHHHHQHHQNQQSTHTHIAHRTHTQEELNLRNKIISDEEDTVRDYEVIHTAVYIHIFHIQVSLV